MHMIHAGIGDILAKTSSLFDWRLSAIATGEHYCDEIAALVRRSLENVIRLSPQAVQRDEEAVRDKLSKLGGTCFEAESAYLALVERP